MTSRNSGGHSSLYGKIEHTQQLVAMLCKPTKEQPEIGRTDFQKGIL